ncbi:hypothetical protein [Solidesulfovibrio sp. C21]|uniref:hypothetical protein n=1 Tax=Solidesulfovibrio sp. C21 TaxID=3398613 RepID=UPI0039FBB215
MATYEELAKAVEGDAPFLARCLRMADNEPCLKLAVDVWARACGESCDLDKLLAAAGDPGNKEKLAAANRDILLWLERVSALQALEQRQARINMGTINVRDYDNTKALNLWAKMVVGGLVVIGFFVGLFFFLIDKSTAANNPQFAFLVGALVTAFTAVVQYFFGSSSGSAEKTLMMQTRENAAPAGASQAGNPPTPAAATPPVMTPPKTP